MCVCVCVCVEKINSKKFVLHGKNNGFRRLAVKNSFLTEKLAVKIRSSRKKLRCGKSKKSIYIYIYSNWKASPCDICRYY